MARETQAEVTRFLLPLLRTFVEAFIETFLCVIVMRLFFWLCCKPRVRFKPRNLQ